jgi:hypothetical protein
MLWQKLHHPTDTNPPDCSRVGANRGFFVDQAIRFGGISGDREKERDGLITGAED